ncbi:MAG: Hpt domain-containing protein, partial [Burkholderiales bacterium]|nr:Hpt domain-containing protein [Burkholderiales bacterium]
LERLGVQEPSLNAIAAHIVGLFLDDTPQQLRRAAQGLAQAERSAVERALHSIRSASEAVGAFALARLAEQAEALARAGSLGAIAPLLPGLHGAFDAAAVELRGLRSAQAQAESAATEG